MQYDLGDTVLLEHEVRVAGELTDATVTLSMADPDAETSSPAVSHVSLGRYRAAVPATLVGPWGGAWSVTGPVVDVVPVAFYVGDPAPPAYAELDDLKEMRRITVTTEDRALLRVLRSSARRIDRKCRRRFWLDRTPVAREFNTAGRLTPDGLLLTDDIGVAEIEVYSGSSGDWSLVDPSTYTTYPDNALIVGEPITALQLSAPWIGRARIVTRWGPPLIPDDITEANLLLANRLYLRKDSPEGVAGGEWGGMRLSRWDPDVEALVEPYVLPNPP